MQISIVLLTLSLAAILIFLGFYLQKIDRNSLFIAMSGGALFLVIGILLFVNPIEYQNGSNTTITGDVLTTEIEYTTVDGQANNIINWVLMLVGMVVISITTFKIYDKKYDEEETYNW